MKIEVGDTVRCINDIPHKNAPGYFPVYGTLGTVLDTWADGSQLLIQWPSGSTSQDDRWWLATNFVEVVTDVG